MSARVLIVDDEPAILTAFQYALSDKDWHVEVAPTAQVALMYFEKERFDVVVTDKNLPDFDGVELLGKLRKRDRRTQFIVITGYATPKSAIAAANLGAVEYLTKPFQDIYAVADVIQGAIDRAQASFRRKTPPPPAADARAVRQVTVAYAPVRGDWLTRVVEKAGSKILVAATVTAFREAMRLGKPKTVILVGSEQSVALVRVARELSPKIRILVVFENPEVAVVRSFILTGVNAMVSEPVGTPDAEAMLVRLLT